MYYQTYASSENFDDELVFNLSYIILSVILLH